MSILLALVIQVPVLAQPHFEIAKVDQVGTSFNTVTCTIHENLSGLFAYTGGDSNKIDVFTIGADGKLSPLDTYVVTGEKQGVRGLITDQIDGKDFLFAGLKGGNAIEVFEIAPDGRLKSVFVFEDTDETHLVRVITLQVVHMKSGSYLFAGGLESSPGLDSFRIHTDGSLELVQAMPDTKDTFTDGVIGMSIHRIAGQTYLFTGGFQDNGLSSWRVYEDGKFENVSNVGDDATRFLNGAYPVISSAVKDWNFVVVGHRHHSYYRPTAWVKDRYTYYYHGDAVSVFWVNPDGQLVPRSVFQGNSETLIKGQTRLQRLPIDENFDLVAVATRDDESIQLCSLNETGRLANAGKLSIGFPVYYGLTGRKIGDSLFLFAGSVEGNEFVSYRLDLKSAEIDNGANLPAVVENNNTQVLRHVVAFRFKADVSDARIQQAVQDFRGLAELIPEIKRFEGGKNLSTMSKNKEFTHWFVLTFDNEEARDIYLPHPDHMRVVEKNKPLLADLLVAEYWGEE
ncbi:MAG: Dabb family protein [Rhodopirellula sp. JB044]|uniref:Dabb family protein n=1 Tax=Rhodopirellula sp. JB044 TaxID=3342844 RepID=UPI00370C6E5E